jgi:hypothetical protein
MSLKKRATLSLRKFNAPINYKVLGDKLADAQNVYDNKGVTETRFGIKKFNTTSLGGSVISTSFFKDNSGDRYLIAKVGTVLYKVNSVGAATSLKTGLSENTKHRGVTLDGRHIIGIETDGLFTFNGTIFTQLGQSQPSSLAVAVSAGGNLDANNDYQVALTFYSTSTGFETNPYESSIISTTTDKTLSITEIPTSAENAFIDAVRIYLKDVEAGGSYSLVTELGLGITSYSITSEPISTIEPPTTHSEPLPGGGKYLTSYGKKIAYTGNSEFKSDVFISEEYIPDAFDNSATTKTLSIEGQGPITGIACGTYSDSNLDPYLAIFKSSSITIYSDIGGNSRQSLLDANIGCVSHDTIKVVNGIIHFMSENGWYRIFNGVILKDEQKNPQSLGDGDIDDIFSRAGWEKELNRLMFPNFFSVVYPTHKQYWTFVTEGANSSFTKAYIYERDINGFRVFTFNTAFTTACEGEDDNGNIVVFLSDSTGTFFTYSVKNPLYDVSAAGTQQAIEAFFILPFMIESDIYSTYNYRFLTVRAIANDNPVTCKVWRNFDLSELQSNEYDFENPVTGFTLDLSQLDVGTLGDDRAIVSKTADINTCAESIMIGFYQSTLGANIGLISAQLQYNKNGNANR